MKRSKPCMEGQQSAPRKWCPPSSGMLKCNLDAAFRNDENLTGLGMCVKDKKGSFIVARSERFSPSLRVTRVRLLASSMLYIGSRLWVRKMFVSRWTENMWWTAAEAF